MPRRMVQKLIIVFAALLIVASSFAQRYHFVYIQADNQQAFYVKYGGKNYSSSSIGYLILPKLSDGDFTVQIGFPKNLYPEQAFNLSVAGKDYGYALKNFNEKGWGLFNFQTTDIVMNVNEAAASGPVAKQTATTNNSNPFGNMLADAINDSTLNQQRVTPKDTMAKAVIQSAVTVATDTSSVVVNAAPSDSGIINPSQTILPTQNAADAAVVDSTMKKYINADSGQKKTLAGSTSVIVKSSESTTNSGTDLTFLDNAGKDTIHAFIPSADTMGINKKAAIADTAKSTIDNPFFSNNNTTNTSVQQPAMPNTANHTGVTNNSVITNSNCQKMLSSYDIDKLKKKIAKTDNQEDILAVIKKALRDKCVTTEQVKDFGNLFSSDENRYNFYDAVYPFVSDYFVFPQLESTLIDTYYKNRFKSILR